MILLTIIVFIGLLLALVLVHEFGHFIAAKRAGCRVEEFGFGFPPRIWGIKRGGTLYSINALPLGGFVKIEGEDMEEDSPKKTSFAAKSAPWRILILAAGVTMNVILAWILLSVQSVVGMPTLITEANSRNLKDQQTYILEVAPDSPAASAGLQPYDRIVSVNGQAKPGIETVQQETAKQRGGELTFVVDRQGVKKTVAVKPRENPPAGEGAVGIAMAATGLRQTPWWTAPWEGLKRTYEMLAAIIMQFGVILSRLFSTGKLGADVSGPVGIAVYTNEVTQLGLGYILEFAALISLNLAIINIFPFPALDGGRIVFVLLEKIRGKRVSRKIEQWTHTVGFALLIILMLLITFRDIRKFF